MRTSSIHIIMAVIALSDAYTVSTAIRIKVDEIITNLYTCQTPNSLFSVQITIILVTILNFTRRTSTWLNFSIALIRTLVVRNPMNPIFERLSQPRAGYYTLLIVMSISGSISTFSFFGLEPYVITTKYVNWCDPNTTELNYDYAVSQLFTDHNGFIIKIFSIFDESASRFIPCLLFPIITIFLIIEVQKAERNHRKVRNHQKTNKAGSSKTKLIFYLTITFFIAEFPLGVITILSPFFSRGFSELIFYASFLFQMLLSTNTSSHMLICLLLSSQYRSAAKQVILSGFSFEKTTTAKTTVVSSKNVQTF